MKKALLLTLILCTTPLVAQQRDVRIRLFAGQTLSLLRIAPRGTAAIDGQAVQVATDISLAAGRITVQGKPAASPNLRVTGTFTVETPGIGPALLRQPLTVTTDGQQLRLFITAPMEEYVAGV